MIAQVNTDRVKNAISVWRQKEKELEELFGKDGLTHTEFLREKLAFFERVYQQYHFRPSREEKLSLAFLDSAIDRLREKVYPFWFDRLMHELGDIFRYDPLRRTLFHEFNWHIKDDLLSAKITHEIKPIEATTLSLKISDHQKINIMNEQNFDYLKKQILYTGFGEDLQRELKEKMSQGASEFTLAHRASFNNDNTEATLYFKKSQTGDMYFFNRYALTIKENEKDAMTQSFNVTRENSITLKEGYNMMQGRSIYKELTNQHQEKYHAWLQLNFKETDTYNNFKLKQFHDNYGYDLASTLARYPIKELESEQNRQSLMRSLEKGNRQSVNIMYEGKEQKMFIEANPQYKSLNIYNTEMLRVNIQAEKQSLGEKQAVSEKQSEKQSEKKSVGQVAEQKQNQKQSKKLSQKNKEGEEGTKNSQRQSRKMRQSQG